MKKKTFSLRALAMAIFLLLAVSASMTGCKVANPAALATETPMVAATAKVSQTPASVQTPKVTETAKATETPKATQTAKVTETPKATQTAKVTETPKATVSTQPTQTPKATQTPKVTQTPQPAETAKLSYEDQVVQLVNEIRAQNGLGALTLNRDLAKVARAKSQDMHDQNYFAHQSPTYGSPFDMMTSFGISYQTAGENIAMGHATPQAVVDAWMDSSGHRANILNAAFTQIGVGYVSDGNYWTQMFIG